jgi:hypothetical protein
MPPIPPSAAHRAGNAVAADDASSDAEATLAKPRVEVFKVNAEVKYEIRTAARAVVDEALVPIARAMDELRAAIEAERRERFEHDAHLAEEIAAVTPKAPPVAHGPPPLPPVVSVTAAQAAEIPITTSTAPPPPLSAPAPVAAPAVAPTPAVAEPKAPAVAAPVPPASPPRAPAKPPVAASMVVRDARPPAVISTPFTGELPGMLDGQRRRRRNTWMMALLLLLVVGGIVLAAILSHALP